METVSLSTLSISTFVVFLAEIGDKTQLLSLMLTLRFRVPWLITLAIFLATVLNHAGAAWVRSLVTGWFSPEVLQYLVAVSFFAVAIWALVPDKLDEKETEMKGYGVFFTATLLFFMAEIGDKTQVATVLSLVSLKCRCRSIGNGTFLIRSRLFENSFTMPQPIAPLNLGQDPVRQCFKHFLMPAITGMVIKSLYIVADIMFIGHSMGEDGLAAINLVLPYFSFMFAVAMMIGVCGAALMSIRFGEGKHEEGQKLFQQALTFVTLVMVSLTVATMVWADEIIIAFGSQGELAPMAKDYVIALTWFATPYTIGWALSNFVRNDGIPSLVMKAMMASATLNVFLDWLFMMVFHWGMFGAGLATGLAQLAMAGVQLYQSCFLTTVMSMGSWTTEQGGMTSNSRAIARNSNAELKFR